VSWVGVTWISLNGENLSEASPVSCRGSGGTRRTAGLRAGGPRAPVGQETVAWTWHRAALSVQSAGVTITQTIGYRVLPATFTQRSFSLHHRAAIVQLMTGEN